MNVLITGGRGFLASHLEKTFRLKGYTVTNVSRSTNPSFESILKSEESYDFYIHTAGLSSDSPFTDPKSYFVSNFDLTTVLFSRFAKDKGAKRFIFISSIHVINETHEATAYVQSKALAEEFLTNNKNERIHILRPALICSPPESRGILGPLKSLAQKGIGIRFPKGFGMSWVSLKTVTDTILNLMEEKNTRQVLNLVDARADLNNPKKWLLDFDVQSIKVILPIPLLLLRIFSVIGQAFRLPFNKYFFKKLQL